MLLISVKPDSVDVLAPILLRYKAAHAAGAILYVSFTTVSEYLWLLRAACECLANLGARACLYLAAAVSDFYIPKDRVVSKHLSIVIIIHTLVISTLSNISCKKYTQMAINIYNVFI